jgi:hypothetical protein
MRKDKKFSSVCPEKRVRAEEVNSAFPHIPFQQCMFIDKHNPESVSNAATLIPQCGHIHTYTHIHYRFNGSNYGPGYIYATNPRSTNHKPIETAMMALGLANQMWLIHHPLGYYMCA